MNLPLEFIPTADLVDIIGPQARCCDTQFRNVGGAKEFCGTITTVRCHEDNALVKKILHKDNPAGVLVVDGGGSLHTALIGDMIAAAGLEHGWAGVIVHGACRDSEVIARMDFGLKALGTNPRKSSKTGEGESGVIVSFGGVDFVPGHVLYSDADGIVVTEHGVAKP
ncbi:regulator of ribonuclease activity [Corynebacterium atypicum]|uniref:4-hydroxy-4-methyl-2-oxoglutarate aldolase n=1 Tax=Corynebacterium atypicum TaxID=191610 RepID=A0ABM5QNN5_9CORY|nr:ribonuclease E activity regulator RraA [Corynebacterium atypicum]AIG64368.1 regulator of ribonuclease activity [Corynebacterium atypicum]